MGRDINSAHGYSVQCWENIQKTKGHIDTVFENLTPKQIADNRLRLSASINVVKWLTFQKCAFRGHVENADSKNQGNFLEMLKLIASYNKDVRDVVLANAPQNAKYIAPSIQKQILHVFAKKVQNEIRKEIGDSKFCIIIDESRDVSKREQMAIVIRFVNKDDLRGQGYDGASNMRGEWNGLQALFIDDCPYAYYVHCLAHQLQLSLIAAAREVSDSSSKRHDELHDSQVAELEHLIEIEEVDTGKGMNQIDLLCRALQQKSQDILHAMDLLVDTKSSIQDLRDEATMDQQLEELNSRFSEKTTELLVLSASLNPDKGYKNFNVDNICRLAEKYYPADFSKDDQFHLSTATYERAFSAMKIVKTSLRNKMEDDFLSEYLIVYIEKDIAEKFTIGSIIDDFNSMKTRRVQFG
ncbi:uncharacterized protein LOC104884624 [Beta vulgaris subsp. vulgaris]|uniref:uncharacterized protein LOC104884624 n=1 Tax=Beta vulgaris subsp. vulgaris TaxID=3555 RepID=UPI002548CE4A|nr:uncharacterized protein LOC104884624 [Beta vulgaris subsp. vulgaris]